MNTSYLICDGKIGTYSWIYTEDMYEHISGTDNIHYVNFNCANPYKIVMDDDMIHIYKYMKDADVSKYPPSNLGELIEIDEDVDEIEEEDSVSRMEQFIKNKDVFLCYIYLFSYKIVKRMAHIDQAIAFAYKEDITSMSLDELGYFAYLGNNKYLYIETDIYEFEPDSEIINYVPERCGDCVPYHYAISANNIYLLGYGKQISMKDYPLDKKRFDPYDYELDHNTHPIENMLIVDRRD